jgi:hypothetical protein
MTEELATQRLGPDTIVASSVNGEPACGSVSRSTATPTGC